MTINFNSHAYLNIPEFKAKTEVLNTNWNKLMSFVNAVEEEFKKNGFIDKTLLDALMMSHVGDVKVDYVKFYNTLARLKGKPLLTYTDTPTDTKVIDIEALLRQHHPLATMYNFTGAEVVNNNREECTKFLDINNFVKPNPTNEKEVKEFTDRLSKYIKTKLEPMSGEGKSMGKYLTDHLDTIAFGVSLEEKCYFFNFNRQVHKLSFDLIFKCKEYLHTTLVRYGSSGFNLKDMIDNFYYNNNRRAAFAEEARSLYLKVIDSDNFYVRLNLAVMMCILPDIIYDKTLVSFHKNGLRLSTNGILTIETLLDVHVKPYICFFKGQLDPNTQALTAADGAETLQVVNSLSYNITSQCNIDVSFIVPSILRAIRIPAGDVGAAGRNGYRDIANRFLRGQVKIYSGCNNEKEVNLISEYVTNTSLFRDRFRQNTLNINDNNDTTLRILDGNVMDLEKLSITTLRAGTKRRGGYHSYNRLNGFWSEDGVDVREEKDKAGNDRLYFGIEIETEANSSYNQGILVFIADTINHNYTWLNNWLIPERDGSIRDGGIEWISTPSTPLVAIEMARLFTSCAVVKDLLVASNACGNHIHMNKKYFTATSFAKLFRFMGGDNINRDFIVRVANRQSERWARMDNKTLLDGEYIHKHNMARAGSYKVNDVKEGEALTRARQLFSGKYSAINIEPANTYECRIFSSYVNADLVKNIQFMYAAVRFATYVHRCKLSSGDFIKWFFRWYDNEKQYPKGTFDELYMWLYRIAKCDNTNTDDDVYNSLLQSKIISPATTAANVVALEKELKEKK